MLGFVVVAALAALLQVPASADPPPEPYRIATGLEGAVSADSVAIGDRVFWLLHGNSGTVSQDTELWTSDGTEAGTHEFFDPNPDGLGRVVSLRAFDDGLVFTADNGTDGQELWHSDGTAAGTAMVADLTPDGATQLLGAGPGAVYVQADDGTHGAEVYRWTGPGSTPQLLDINTTVLMTSDPELEGEWSTSWTDANPISLGMVGDTLLFTADQSIRTAAVNEWGDHYVALSGTGRELWRVGPSGLPSLVKDISTEEPQQSTRFPFMTGTASMGGSLYFLTEGTDSDFAGPELWRTDGTPGGTSLVASLRIAFLGDHWDFEPVTAGGKLFYSSWNGDWDGLWATDGTSAGQRVSLPGDAGSAVALGTGVVFSLTQPATGRELWHSDGSTSTLLGDLRAGTPGSNPFPFEAWGSHVYFGASNSTGRNLFRTDGTVAGTELVHDLPNLAGAVTDGPMVFYGAASRLYFINSPDNDRNVGNELWAFDPNRVVEQKASSTTLRAPAAIAYGAGGTVTVTVSGTSGPPTGTVTISDGGQVLATVALVAGNATFTLPKDLALGAHTLTATYSGSSAFLASASTPVNVAVKAATKLTGRVTDLVFGAREKIRVTARLTTTPAINATGRLTLLIDGKKHLTVNLTAANGNRLTLVGNPVRIGQHRLQVTFSNSPNAMNAKTGIATIQVIR
ncbi:hypothetical protein ASD66_13815 [Nocardioides sp. Root151]|nr:hypothetical protein ASD66_13815 [Nocardioides sp. Root151]